MRSSKASLILILNVATVFYNTATAGNPPANMPAFECAIAQFTETYAMSKLVFESDPLDPQRIHDALNVDFLCNSTTASPPLLWLTPEIASGFARKRQEAFAKQEAAYANIFPYTIQPQNSSSSSSSSSSISSVPVNIFFVNATGGSDSNSGTIESPFATLGRAQQATRAISPRYPGTTIVYLRAGTYHLSTSPLVLTELDSNVTWSSYPADGYVSVVLTGSFALSNLQWSLVNDGEGVGVKNGRETGRNLPNGVYSTPLAFTDARREAWFQSHPGWSGAAPSPQLSGLFVNGYRAVRARYPNADPQTGAGKCFSSTQRPGEGCTGYSSCTQSGTGTFPASPGVSINNISPNRANSPTYGCPQCGGGGSFQYTIYPFPEDHPVYNEPLPGIGWTNLSLFSFWASPFSRPAGINVAAGTCDPHWGNTVYSSTNGTDAVVHMFHQGLWGGHQYAVNNVSYNSGPPPSSASSPSASSSSIPIHKTHVLDLPSDVVLWLRADDIPVSQDGQHISSWTDASPTGATATQPTTTLQPTYHANLFPGGKPTVSFDGTQYLMNGGAPTLSSESTIFAVVYDNGTTTTYGSGVFFSRGGLNGVGTQHTVATEHNDDDPAPVGTFISAVMIDWAGSPALPGQRNVLQKPSILAVEYESGGSYAFVDGCLDVTAGAQGANGQGYEIGTRNAEMGRYLIGDISEILVFNRALNVSERAAVTQYLAEKWNIPSPKHCAQPVTDTIAINFGYGGFQEARGCGVGGGQHFYIENVLEELDVPGEWYYDYQGQTLYYYPNITDNTPAPQFLSQSTFEMPTMNSIIVVNGSQSGTTNYATNINFYGLSFTQSRSTFLEPYEVPSGGDWSVHRGGALFVQDAENINIQNCVFNQTGGNAVIFSNHVYNSSIQDGRFMFIGDSAIILLGSTVSVDGSLPTYPNKSLISRCHISEIGIFGKQTSCVGLSLTANTTIEDIVCYNGPRAGINDNDGFGGGTRFSDSVVWNMVRETGDHGNLNTWMRQPYWTYSGMQDGFNDPQGRSFIKAYDINTHNLILNGYSGVWAYDHDDDSQFVQDSSSMMVFGGCKNYLGHTKACGVRPDLPYGGMLNDNVGNVILYPGTNGRSQGNRRCQTDDNGQFANQYHIGNTCTSADGDFYSFSNCQLNPGNLNTTVFVTANNTLYADAGTSFDTVCDSSTTFSAWQALGQDTGSSTSPTPDIPTLIHMGASVLNIV